MSRFVRFHAAGGLLLLVAALAAPSRAAETPALANPGLLRQQTVLIQVERTEGGNKIKKNGSGVLLCQVDNQVYVLTADHVIYGKNRLVLPLDVKKIHLSFYRGARPVSEVRDEKGGRSSVFTPRRVPDEDLLLLSFQVEADLTAFRAQPRTIPLAEDTPDGLRHKVHAIGYRLSTSESWAEAQGDFLRREDDFLHHSAAIEEGFSGGPLFDEFGAWIGLNIQAPEDRSTPGGRAVPIDKIRPAIRNWVPADCLPNNDEEKAKKARELYREAMRWVSLRNWEKAEDKLKEAIDEDSLEGGESVHLQGMRYTEYLPYFHLGLALYHQGKYGPALRALQISEVQDVISGNKRFKDLKRIRANCQKNLTRDIEAMRVSSE